MTSFHQTAALAVLGGVLLAPTTPTRATPPLPLPIPVPTRIMGDDRSDVADLKKQVEESNKKLTTISEQLKQLTELLNGKKDATGFPLPSDPGLVAQVKDLKDKLAAIDRDLSSLKTQSSSLRPVSPITPLSPIVDPKAGKGTIRVVNEYPVQISIVVNGTSYRIAPSKSLDVEVPAGEFTYQLLESGAAGTRSVIKEKETVTLRIK